MNPVMVDSSVWIFYFKGKKSIFEKIEPRIDENCIHYNGIIMAELLIGARNQKEYTFLEENFSGFNYIPVTRDDFFELAALGNICRKKGYKIPLTDLLIAVHCIKHRLELFTDDKHFNIIAKHSPLKLSRLLINREIS